MKLFLFSVVAFTLFSLTTTAQRAASDEIETSEGPLTVQPILHGTVAFTWQGQTIYADPYGGAEAFEGVAAPNLILITDIHGDHMDPKTLEALETSEAVLVVPQAVADQLPETYQEQLVVIDNGETTEQLGIFIQAIPMYNLPEEPDSRHVKGRGNGYLLTFGDKHIYLSGDTEDIEEMRALEGVDVAFVCMNLPYTMGIEQAASAVLDFQPNIVYPYHYRGPDGLSDVEKFKKLVNAENKTTEVRLRSWYPEK